VVTRVCIPPSTTHCLQDKEVMGTETMGMEATIPKLRPARDGTPLVLEVILDSLVLAVDEVTILSVEVLEVAI
jgi:hypothetical protein